MKTANELILLTNGNKRLSDIKEFVYTQGLKFPQTLGTTIDTGIRLNLLSEVQKEYNVCFDSEVAKEYCQHYTNDFNKRMVSSES